MEVKEIEKLVEWARTGNREARGRLVEAFDGLLRSWIRLRLGRRLARAVNAEDVFQETFIQAFGAIERLEWRGEEAFAGWLRTIAEHVIQGELKRIGAKKRAADRGVSLQDEIGGGLGRPVALEALVASPDPTASKELRRQERFRRLEAALDSLPPDHRKVIQLVSVKGLSLKEAARRMGRSPDAVTMLHLRALRRLRAAYGKEATESLHLPRDRTLDSGREEDG